MSYCRIFKTEEEAIQNIGTKECSKCEYYVYQDGLATCQKMLNKFDNERTDIE